MFHDSDELYGYAGPAGGARMGGFFGQTGPYDDPAEVGALPTDEFVGAYCAHCGGEQMGYYGAYPDNHMLGSYCPGCGVADPLPGSFAAGAADEYGDVGWLGQEDELYGYGEYDEPDPFGYYGPYREQAFGADEEADFGGYVSDVPPPFNPHVQPGPTNPAPLAGYEPERTADPTIVKPTTVAPSAGEVPQIFKPYL